MGDDKLTIADAEKRKVECKVFSRIVGYLTSVDTWNPGKFQEMQERMTFKLPEDDSE